MHPQVFILIGTLSGLLFFGTGCSESTPGETPQNPAETIPEATESGESGSNGNTDTAGAPNQPPEAVIELFSLGTGAAPLTVTLNASNSRDSN